ncbi:c-type cytochrome [Sphingobium sp. B2]|uniref:c-type cytochrome n=1 Tax=Sphingobium sp. B2 TaxID=2583228 RepID=UPI0011A260FD|nr:c-type cytochrome [Sphingobium sp. B2]
MTFKRAMLFLPFALAACGGDGVDKAASAKVEKGARVFERVCSACHAIGGGNRVGPDLKGIIGRHVGSAPGFAYSDAMKADAASTWSDERIKSFVMGPLQMYPEGRMVISPMSPEDADAVVAYIKDQ